MQKGSKIKDLARAAVFAAVAFFAFASAQAEWLYWQVDFNADGAKQLVPEWSGSSNPYVWLVMLDNTTGEKSILTGKTETGESVTYIQLTQTKKKDASGNVTVTEFAMSISQDDLGTLTDEKATRYSFLVEMGNLVRDDSGNITGVETLYTTQTPLSYGALSDEKYKYIRDGDSFSNQGAWNPALIGFKAVPEPTGGMLFGFGLCLLALRRRRKRGAA